MSYLGYCREVSAVRVPWFRCVRCPFGPSREGPTSRRARTCLWTQLCNRPASAHRRSSSPCPGSVWKKATQLLTLDYCASYLEQTKLIQGNTAKAGKPKRKLFFYFYFFAGTIKSMTVMLQNCNSTRGFVFDKGCIILWLSKLIHPTGFSATNGENTYAEKIHPLTF